MIGRMAPAEPTKGSRVPINAGERVDSVKFAPIETPTESLVQHPGYVPDVKWFTLGPVYFIMGLSYSILNLFQQTPEGDACRYAVRHSGYMFLPDIPGWEDTIESVPTNDWDMFLMFLGECGFYSRSTPDSVWSLYGTEIAVPDTAGGAFLLTVFTPWGPEYRVSPVWDPTARVIHFTKEHVPLDPRFNEVASSLKG